MIISETTDIEMLKRMQIAGESHVKRCLKPSTVEEFNYEYNPKKANEINADLTAIKLRIKELTN